MHQVHPDAAADGSQSTEEAQRLNLAYSILKGKMDSEKEEMGHPASGTFREKKSSWNGPVNPQAYAEREIFHYAEDQEGNILGSFSVAKGKYLWTREEDFRLFLLSIYRCVRQLLEARRISAGKGERTEKSRFLEAELTYLLAQQFIDGTGLLRELAGGKTEEDGAEIFLLQAMAELTGAAVLPGPGQRLAPGRISRHRLYLKDETGREIGYLSFPDDRLYYVVIPMFEQRRGQVKIQAAAKQPHRKKSRYCNLQLWLRLPAKASGRQPENLSQQIEKLLDQYGAELDNSTRSR